MSVIDSDAPSPRRRSWVEVRWRQFRHAPRPVVRAVMSSLVVAIGCGLAYLAYDVAITRGAELPGGDLRALAVVLEVLVVLATGTFVTWHVVPRPSGSASRPRRTPWSAALGLLAAIPIAYLALVVIVQVVKPFLIGT